MDTARKALLSFAFLLSLPGFCFAEKEDVRMMVHLLDYIAVDYSMAIENGEIISVAEYQEMKEFAKTISSLGSKVPADIQSDILLLQELVDKKETQQKISSVATGIKQQLISHYQLEIAPKRWPSISNGKTLFALHCQSCHGPSGKGDGPLGVGLEPAPTNFHDPDKANGLSPFQAYNTIRLGVENTGMRAFNELSDDEVWDLAFYVLSLPHAEKKISMQVAQKNIDTNITLEQLASLNNEELRSQIKLNENMPSLIPALRLFPRELAENSQGGYLDKAVRLIEESIISYQEGDRKNARNLALTAYLEGVEPIEIQLRANNASFVAELEMQLGRMRSYIESGKDVGIIESTGARSIEMLREAQVILKEKAFTGWVAFLLSSSIILREGLEAFLVIITILGIIRALKLKNATAWIHAGWISAVISGFILWLLADRFFTFSGAQREVMEGAIAIFAVGVLLYVGFWMHSKSEAGKWQAYVKNKIQRLARKENMLGLAFLSFLVVFREAFESVLFLSALNMEVGESNQAAFTSGIVVAFAALAVISVLLLKYSRKIPITKLFRYSSMIISFLAVILIGKGVNALQEAGAISISVIPVNFRIDMIGVYPTWETISSQLIIIILIVFLWKLGNRPVKTVVPASAIR